MDIFDEASNWKFAPRGICTREKVSPNLIAYHEELKTLALVVKRGGSGGFALSEGGLNFICTALERGQRNDGKPVDKAIVVLAEPDLGSSNGAEHLKSVGIHTAAEMRARFKDVPPYPGNFGTPYWWVTVDDEDW